MHERVGVDHLDSHRRRVDHRGVGAGQLTGRIREQRPDPLTAFQHGIAHPDFQSCDRRMRRGEGSVERMLDAPLPFAHPDFERNVVTHALAAVRRERLEHALLQDFDLLLGILQDGLAVLDQLGAALIGGQRLLEWHLPAFHRRDELLELRERGFEGERGLGRFGHG